MNYWNFVGYKTDHPIFLATDSISTPCVQNTLGCTLAKSETEVIDVIYVDDAYVPKANWSASKLSPSKVTCTEPSNTIAVIQIPQEVFKAFRNSGVHEIQTSEDRICVEQSISFKNAVAQFTNFARQFHVEERDIIHNGLAVHLPGKTTTTYERHNQLFVGLHVDSWDHRTLGQRRDSRNRICVNIGKKNRFLICVPSELVGLAMRISPAGHVLDSNFRNVNRIVTSYLDQNQDLPIFRIGIRPGEAYIAPTENMIHDGSTLESDCIDVNYTLRGLFNPMLAKA